MVQKGYDNSEGGTGALMATLILNVTEYDYGYYECKTQDSGKIIQNFNLYIESSEYLLVPAPRIPLIRINSGGSAIGNEIYSNAI